MPTDPNQVLVDAAALAELLGVSLITVRRWDSAGKLPAPRRLGACVRWDLAEIRAWSAAGCPQRSEWRRASA